MKYTITLKLVLFCFICAFLAVSCVKEGPEGPAGTDGTDGTDGMDGADGQVTCLACHGSNLIESTQAEFAMSEHRAGAIAVDYAGGRKDCAQCHSHEGFVQYAEFGFVLGDIISPSAWKCSTCHGIHKTFESGDFALRLSDAVTANFDNSVTMDLQGNSNLCANCHQSRTGEPEVTNPGEETFTITSTHWGPHHGPQANVVAGAGFAEIEGPVDYPTAGSSYHLTYNGESNSCVGCHMGNFSSVDTDGDGTADISAGGHSWIPNLAACIDCHGTDMEDYNYGGRQSTTKIQLEELRDKLIALGVVSGDETNGYHPVAGTYPTLYARAYFNYIGLEEDRSLGAHNPKYVNALLTNTLAALNAATE